VATNLCISIALYLMLTGQPVARLQLDYMPIPDLSLSYEPK